MNEHPLGHPATRKVDPSRLPDLLDAVMVVGADLDLDSTLRRITAAAVNLIGTSYGALGVRHTDGTLSQFIQVGIPPATLETMGPFPSGRGLLAMLLQEPRVLHVPDISKHPQSVGFPPNHPPMHNMLGASITVRGTIFGSLYLTQKDSGFTESDEATIEVLAAAAAIAIDNAALYRQSRSRERWLLSMSELTSKLLNGEPATDFIEFGLSEITELSGAATVSRPPGGPLHAVQDAGDEPWDSETVARITDYSNMIELGLRFLDHQKRSREAGIMADRDRIARDLHDHVIQRLYATGLGLQRATSSSDPTAAAAVSRSLEQLDRTIREIRTAIYRISDDSDKRSVRHRVQAILAEAAAHTDMEIDVHYSGPVDTLIGDNLVPHVEAVVREGVSNSLRHSGGTQVAVVVSASDDLTVTVTDDGAHSDDDTSGEITAAGRGLDNLTERASLVGGACTISLSGSGTQLKWSAPLD